MHYEQKRTTNKNNDPILEIRRDAKFVTETLVMRGNQSAKWVEIKVKESDGSFARILITPQKARTIARFLLEMDALLSPEIDK